MPPGSDSHYGLSASMEDESRSWRGLLVWLENDGPGLTPLSLEIAALAAELGRAAETTEITGLLALDDPPPELEPAELLAGLPLDRVLVYPGPAAPGYRADFGAAALTDGVNRQRPAVVLVGASDRGRDVAALAAAGLGAGLTADCTGLEMASDGSLLQIRPAFGGDMMAEILTPRARPQFATVRAGVFRGAPPVVSTSNYSHLASTAMAGARPKMRFLPGAWPVRPQNQSLRSVGPVRPAPEIIRRPPPAAAAGLTVLKREKIAPLAADPSRARLVVVAGGGVRAAADLEPLRALTEDLGGVLASSRALVERGWMPPESQIGLSGRAVAPAMMITLGVSGSVQFMAGIGGVGFLAAVNRDPQAPIFAAAHLPLCADLYEVWPALIHLTEKNQREKP